MFSRHVSHVSPCQDSPLCLLQPRQRARGGAGAAGRGARREVRGAEQARAGQLVSPGGQVREAVNHISQNFHNIRKGSFCPSLPSYRMSLLRNTDVKASWHLAYSWPSPNIVKISRIFVDIDSYIDVVLMLMIMIMMITGTRSTTCTRASWRTCLRCGTSRSPRTPPPPRARSGSSSAACATPATSAPSCAPATTWAWRGSWWRGRGVR